MADPLSSAVPSVSTLPIFVPQSCKQCKDEQVRANGDVMGTSIEVNGSSAAHAPPKTTPLIIVGGGPVGLSCSILCSLRGIDHVLFERHASTSIHPKACGINQRTSEIFRVMGIEDEVYKHAAPPEIAGRTAWYTSLGTAGRLIHSRDAWGGGQYREEYEAYSPSKYCILPQIRLEPILKQRALQLNPHGIFYRSEVVDIEQYGNEVLVTVEDRATGNIRTERALYAVVADGGRSFTNRLGIRWKGEAGILDMVTAHFRAPIRPIHPDPRNFMTWFSSPEMGGSTRTGYLYQIGPWPDCIVDPSLEEWVFACAKLPSDPATFDQSSMIERLRRTIGVPDLAVEMLSFSHWTVNAIYAERWRLGKIFLVGDSSHKIPPWGALGMNTGIQDVQNLVWKLDLALQYPGQYDDLLDTFEHERLDVGERVGLSSLKNMRSHSLIMDKALGVSADQSAEENIREAMAYFDPYHPQYASKKAAVEEASTILDTEFKAPGYEIGWFYPSADINSEGGLDHGGQLNTDGSLVYDFFYQSTIPGHHLPHAWIESRTGERVAIRDLLHLDRLTLFCNHDAHLAITGDERVAVVVVGPDGWRDQNSTWQKLRGVDENGGVLVRPDGIVAWRGPLNEFDGMQWQHLLDRILRVRSDSCER